MTQKKIIPYYSGSYRKGFHFFWVWVTLYYHVDPLTDDESTEKSDTLDKDENITKNHQETGLVTTDQTQSSLKNDMKKSSASFLHLEVIHGKKHGKVDSESFRWIPN